jgi:hypothetical protein
MLNGLSEPSNVSALKFFFQLSAALQPPLSFRAAASSTRKKSSSKLRGCFVVQNQRRKRSEKSFPTMSVALKATQRKYNFFLPSLLVLFLLRGRDGRDLPLNLI